MAAPKNNKYASFNNLEKLQTKKKGRIGLKII